MKTLVVLLLTFFISFSQGQSFGLTESDYDEDKTTSELSDKPPVKPNQWVHSVIFEPLPKVKLTRSSYQVTTFLDFQLFIDGFEKVNDYIEQFKKDLDNPEYVDIIPKRIENMEITLQNDTDMSHLLDSRGCHVQPHQCLASLKIVKFKVEVTYVHTIFENIHQRFLAAFDHLKYHHSSTTNETQNKHNTDDSHSKFRNESIPLEEQNDVVLDILWKLKQPSPDEYARVKCKKRTGLITWILGWGIFSNLHNIKKLKKEY